MLAGLQVEGRDAFHGSRERRTRLRCVSVQTRHRCRVGGTRHKRGTLVARRTGPSQGSPARRILLSRCVTAANLAALRHWAQARDSITSVPNATVSLALQSLWYGNSQLLSDLPFNSETPVRSTAMKNRYVAFLLVMTLVACSSGRPHGAAAADTTAQKRSRPGDGAQVDQYQWHTPKAFRAHRAYFAARSAPGSVRTGRSRHHRNCAECGASVRHRLASAQQPRSTRANGDGQNPGWQ